MRNTWFKNVLKGLWVGSTMTVPGVSGGTMAVVVGIYEDLISALNGLKTNPKAHLPFLLQFVLGAGIGFLVFARVVTALLESERTSDLTKLFFCGIVIGGIPLLVRKSGVDKLKWRYIVCVGMGAFIVLGIMKLPTGLFVAGDGMKYWILQFVAGVIVAIALVLPGISVTHILYILGLYKDVLQRIYELQLISLFPLAAGGLVGVFLTADLLEKGMRRYPKEVYMTIIGFVAGSLVQLIPENAMGTSLVGLGITLLGFVGMYVLTKKAEG